MAFAGLTHSLSLGPQRLESILGFASSITPSQVIDKTNQEREQAGLSPLTMNQTLNQAALSKGQDMMTDQYWAHVSPDGTQPWFFIRGAGYDYRVAGENLARDFSDTSSMMSAWMASPTHRANILNPKYQEIGIAVIDGQLLGYETTLVVQMFGTPTTGATPKIDVAGVTQTEPSKVLADEDTQASVDSNQDAGSQLPSVDSPVNAVDGGGEASSEVLASALLPVGEIEVPPLLTPLQLTKAFFLSLIMIITSTLLYDGFVIGHRRTARMVGKNLAHLLYFGVLAFLVIFFKAGLVG